jgi:putative photosynthetic complex assembly protein 2
LLALAVGVFMVTAGCSNRVGLCTYLILWVMRRSAKLNIFLGVRNLSETFLPGTLCARYLPTYFQRKPINPLFPLVVTVADGHRGGRLGVRVDASRRRVPTGGRGSGLDAAQPRHPRHLFMVLPIPFSASGDGPWPGVVNARPVPDSAWR